MSGWIGVDLDGTLAHHGEWREDRIGEPIPLMLARVKRWVAGGNEVRIFTARCSPLPGVIERGHDLGVLLVVSSPAAVRAVKSVQMIRAWCKAHVGVVLPVTCQKDFAMLELWDDRAIGVRMNTGLRADGRPD